MVRSVIEGGLTKGSAAVQRISTTAKTVANGSDGSAREEVLHNGSLKTLSLSSQTPPPTCAAVEALRRQRHTGKQIAAEDQHAAGDGRRILRRLGLKRATALDRPSRSALSARNPVT